MPVLENIGCLAVCPSAMGQDELEPICGAALVWDQDVVLWRGPSSRLPLEFEGMEKLDAHGRLVVPGLVDCHTHLAFGGWRAGEFRQRLLGKSYQEIAGEGGGISSTVRSTREESEELILQKSLNHLREMVALGVTTVECKSGYGLDVETELKLLRIYRRLSELQPVRIIPTFLAHIVPAEFQGRRGDYVELLVKELIPIVADEGLARFCDVFVEESAFTVEEARLIFSAAKRHGLVPKVHADQFTDGGGALLAAEMGAASADHLERVSDGGIHALRNADVTAVCLPLATLYLGQPPMQARKLIDHGVRVAVGTDFNPGSAPSFHIGLAMTLACLLNRMTPEEALKGTTAVAARAVGLSGEVGTLEAGTKADFSIIDAPDFAHWLYHFRPNACAEVYIGGQRVVPQN